MASAAAADSKTANVGVVSTDAKASSSSKDTKGEAKEVLTGLKKEMDEGSPRLPLLPLLLFSMHRSSPPFSCFCLFV
jgi:hypothetical protein